METGFLLGWAIGVFIAVFCYVTVIIAAIVVATHLPKMLTVLRQIKHTIDKD